MSRYIDADHLKKSVVGLANCYSGFSDTYDKSCIIGLIDEEPTVDAVPVVRCKDCKWLDYYDTREGKEYLCCREGFPVDLNDFCSWGKKVTE